MPNNADSALPEAASDGLAPLPVHRAIDGLATVGIEVQMLRRRLNRQEEIVLHEFDDALGRIERQLEGLAVIVASLRDTSGD